VRKSDSYPFSKSPMLAERFRMKQGKEIHRIAEVKCVRNVIWC